MLSDRSEIAKRFGKVRLLDVARELGMIVTSSTHIYRLTADIQKDLDDNGVPEDDISEDLFDFLVATGYITEDGDLIEEDEEVETKVTKADLPECWGWGDPENDKACERCPRNAQCVKVRDEVNIPSMVCFGDMYDEHDKQCKTCVLWRLCASASE